jgi:hypothetical protein
VTVYRIRGYAVVEGRTLPFVVHLRPYRCYQEFDREVCLTIKAYVRAAMPDEPGMDDPYVVVVELSPGLRLSRSVA